MPPPPAATPDALLDRLEALSPRSAGLLERAVIAGTSPQALAAWLGVGEEALGIALLRATRELRGEPVPSDDPDAARALLAALRGTSTTSPDAAALEPLRLHAAQVRALAELRHARRTRFDGWLRAAALIALAALAFWLWR